MSGMPRAAELGVVGCHTCGMVCERIAGDHLDDCPRCRSPLHLRKVDGITRAWALLIAGIAFYIPANVMPVMYTSMLGSGGESTIMSGVIEFWDSGAWDIALLIFIASVAVPCTKFVVMALLLATSQRRSTRARDERARLYRLVEIIGYWSMLDVLVVALVAALVQFKALGHVEPRIGIFFFGMVVILTMLSAMSFDPRSIWDAESPDEPNS